MSDLQAHNRSEWRANTRDQMKDFACEGARERLERMLVPLRGNHAELLVEKAGGSLSGEFSEALDATLDAYEDALRTMVANTRTLAEMLALRCRYCGEQSCDRREEHDRWYRASETTVREQASAVSAVGVAAPSAPTSAVGEQSAAADGVAGLAGPAGHPSLEGGAGADTGRSVPARGGCEPYADETHEWRRHYHVSDPDPERGFAAYFMVCAKCTTWRQIDRARWLALPEREAVQP